MVNWGEPGSVDLGEAHSCSYGSTRSFVLAGGGKATLAGEALC